MSILTFFAPAGSSGRTTAVMATASAIIAAGKPVGVIDMTEEARPVLSDDDLSSLQLWGESVYRSGVKDEQFMLEWAYDFESMIRALCACEFEDMEFILVDTPRDPNDLVLDMLTRSRLIIVPFTSATEATHCSAWLADNPHQSAKAYGLLTGPPDEDAEQSARAAFTGAPVLDTELPWSEMFPRQPAEGHLFAMDTHDGSGRNETPQHLLKALQNREACMSTEALGRELHELVAQSFRTEYGVT